MYTQCPACSTLFRIHAHQLKAANGQVRCGMCRHVFNALEALAERPQELVTPASPPVARGAPAAAPAPAPVEAPVTTRLAAHAPAEPDHGVRSFSFEGPAREPAPDHEEDTAPRSFFNLDALKHEEPETSPWAFASASRGSAPAYAAPPARQPEVETGGEPPIKHLPLDPATAASIEELLRPNLEAHARHADAAPPPSGEEHDRGPFFKMDTAETFEPVEPLAAGGQRAAPPPGDDFPLVKTPGQDDAPHATGPEPYLNLDAPTEEAAHARIAAQARLELEAAPASSESWLKTALWSVANLALIVALTGQYVYFQRDSLAKLPEMRPWLERMCAFAGCELPLERDAKSVRLTERSVRANPDRPNSLRVDATLANEADFPQPYPVLELAFSGLQGDLHAGRRFRPQEYLPPGTDIEKGIPPHSLVAIRFEIVDPGKDAVSFQFELK